MVLQCSPSYFKSPVILSLSLSLYLSIYLSLSPLQTTLIPLPNMRIIRNSVIEGQKEKGVENNNDMKEEVSDKEREGYLKGENGL